MNYDYVQRFLKKCTHSDNKDIEFALEYSDLIARKTGKISRFRKSLEEMIPGSTVVEIGPGRTPQKCLFQFSPGEYICVEATDVRPKDDLPEFVELVNTIDGLSYLQKEIEDNSAVILSSAVFDDFILDREYARELAKEIFKKTKPNGLSLHYALNGYELGFSSAGFKLEYPVNNRGLFLFRKPKTL